jgi:putative transposase
VNIEGDKPGLPHRKQLRRRENPVDERFITFSAYRRLPLLESAAVATMLVEWLGVARRDHGLSLFAWVIMPEHVHLLIRAAGSPWSVVAEAMKTQVARRALAMWRQAEAPILKSIVHAEGARPRFWQHGGGFDRAQRDMAEFVRTVKYIHQRPEDWRWSSVRWWMGLREGELECDPPPGHPGMWERSGFV